MKLIYHLYRTRPLLLLYSIAILFVVLYDVTQNITSFDTPYYILAGEKWFHGEMDCLRTPVYPLFLKVCSLPFGDKGLLVVVTIIQSLIFLISVNSFYKLSKQIIPNSHICFVITLFYIIYPSSGWCNELLTESLSISGCIILTHLIFKFVNKNSLAINILIPLVVLLLVFLRPNFIIFFAILPVLWLYLLITTKGKRFVLALILCIIPIGSYYKYCDMYRSEYGLFTSTLSHECNTIYDLKRSNSWDVTSLKDSSTIKVCKQIDSLWTCNYAPIYQIVDETKNAKVIKEMSDQMREQHKSQYKEYKIKNLFIGMSEEFPPGVNSHGAVAGVLFILCKLIAVPVSLLYLVVILSVGILLIYSIRHKTVPLYSAILIAIVTAQCVGISISASEAYARLLLPVYPMFILLLGYAFYKVSLFLVKGNF